MKNQFLFSLIIILCIFGCKDNPTDGGDNPLALSLKVTDADGRPLAGVDFHYIFYMGYDVVYRNAQIEFSLPVTDTVSLYIYDAFQRLIATPLDHQIMPAGIHIVFYNADTLTNGAYEYRLLRSSSTTTGKFFIRTDDPAKLKSLSAFAQTDHKGNLTLNYSTLGIGEKFNIPGNTMIPQEVTISDSIIVLLFKAGYDDFTEGIKLNTTGTTEKTIHMLPEIQAQP